MGAVSATWSFVADLDLTKPQLAAPGPEQWVRYGESMGFAWVPVPAAVGYRLTVHQRNTDQTVGEVVAQIDSGFKESTTAGKLFISVGASDVSTHTAEYCWTVRALGPGSLPGALSDVWCYRIGAATVHIVSPEHGAENVEYDPTLLTWTCPYCPGGFSLHYSYSQGACSSHPPPGATAVTLPPMVDSHPLTLAPDTLYCASVSGLNPDGSKAPGSIVQFRTKAKPPPPPSTCKPLISEAITWGVPLWYSTLPSGWNGKVAWVEEDPSIHQYKVILYAHPPGAAATWSWPGPTVTSASLQYDGTDPYGRAYTLNLLGVPGSISTGWLYAVVVYARSGADCNWTAVGGVDGLTFYW